MTEQEAVKKICPFRVTQIDQAPGLCHASSCMLWRWYDGPIEFKNGVLLKNKEKDWEFHAGEGNGFGIVKRPYGDRRPGGCGMKSKING